MSTAPQLGFATSAAASPSAPDAAVPLSKPPASLDDFAALKPAALAALYKR